MLALCKRELQQKILPTVGEETGVSRPQRCTRGHVGDWTPERSACFAARRDAPVPACGSQPGKPSLRASSRLLHTNEWLSASISTHSAKQILLTSTRRPRTCSKTRILVSMTCSTFGPTIRCSTREGSGSLADGGRGCRDGLGRFDRAFTLWRPRQVPTRRLLRGIFGPRHHLPEGPQ